MTGVLPGAELALLRGCGNDSDGRRGDPHVPAARPTPSTWSYSSTSSPACSGGRPSGSTSCSASRRGSAGTSPAFPSRTGWSLGRPPAGTAESEDQAPHRRRRNGSQPRGAAPPGRSGAGRSARRPAGYPTAATSSRTSWHCCHPPQLRRVGGASGPDQPRPQADGTSHVVRASRPSPNSRRCLAPPRPGWSGDPRELRVDVASRFESEIDGRHFTQHCVAAPMIRDSATASA
jgi:hypothetical protein